MLDCTIVVCSCDDYEDTWELFFCALRDNWKNLSYNVVLNTESKKTDIPGITTFNSYYLKGNDKWGERLINTLNSIESEYVLVVYDDYVLEKKVNVDEVNKCIERMKNNKDIAAFYLTTCSPDAVKDDTFSMFDRLAKRADYKLNSAPGVWNKKKLLSYLNNDDTPWAWEYFGSYLTYNKGDLFYQVKSEMENIFPYYTLGGAIYRGKWQCERVKPLIEKYNLSLDLNKRGCSSSDQSENKRTLNWKINFFRKGYEMIGFAIFIFVYRILKGKIFKKVKGF